MQPFFLSFGISGAQWGVLRTLGRLEASGKSEVRLGELSEELLVQPPSLTSVVDRLERMGLLRRSRGRDDQRVRQISLTPKGNALLRRVSKAHALRLARALSGLSPDEQAALIALLHKLTDHLRELCTYG
jgi:MarR family 2-MHQ and catechol resistance regulon transcriptional repressor